MAMAMNSGPRVIGEYTVTQQIGAGSFAVVWEAHHTQRPGLQVAIKEIATDRLNEKLQESLQSEIVILQRTNDHPNIIRLYDIVQGQNRIYLVLEYCAGGDLAAYIQRYGKVSEVVARHFMRQLGAGLQVLRNNNLIHRDLKPQNLLLSTNDEHAVLKIADFGFARSLMPHGTAETLCGSPLYMAPEILQGKRYDAKADLWSVGAILFQLVTGRPPFSGHNHVQLLHNIEKSTGVRFPDEVSAQLHPDCLDLCRKLLRRNPVERLAFEEFFAHPFMEAMRPMPEDIQAKGSTSGGIGEKSEGKSFPFSVDDERQGSLDGKSSYVRPPSSSSLFLPGKINVGYSSPTPVAFPPIDDRSRILDRGAEGSADLNHSGSSAKGALGDSTDTIERDYVLVTPPITSTESLAMSMSASDFQYTGKGINNSPNRVNVGTTNSGGVGSGASTSTSAPSQSSSEVEGPSQHPPSRLSSLRRCARLITELATDKMNAGLGLESFSIQLVCLAIWKEALRVSKTWAEVVGGSGNIGSSQGRGSSSEGVKSQERSVANTCSVMEWEFALAVERAESLSVHINIGDDMPDAMELIFQTALALGKAAAVDEFMGSMTNAASAYEKAAALLYFLVVEAAALPIRPPLLLSDIDRHRLRRYADALTAHQHQCTAAAQARHAES